MERKYPGKFEVAHRFVVDARDFITRFRCTYYSEKFDFQSIKSRRMKAFIDLRAALECLLKAYIALRQPYTSGGLKLIKRIESYGHNLDKLFVEVCALWKVSVSEDWKQIVQDCSKLPVGIRYALDAHDFREMEIEHYYRTIGSDYWMRHFYEELHVIESHLRKMFKRKNTFVFASNFPLEQFINHEYKYQKNKIR